MKDLLEEYAKMLDDSHQHLSHSALATYNNFKDNLSDKELRFVERHLAFCLVCNDVLKKIVEEDREMEKLIEDEDSVPTSYRFLSKFATSRLVRYSAAAVVAIAVLMAAYYSLFNKQEVIITEIIKPKTDTTTVPLVVETEQESQEKTENGMSQKRFAVNTVLDNFIARNIRSEVKVELLNPRIGDTVHSPITFRWNPGTGVGTGRLIIVDNQNQSLFQAKISGNEFTTNERLNKGLYYWKLEISGKLEAVGKFYVTK